MDYLIIVALFLAGCITNAMSTLKTIFTAKKYTQPVYFIVFVDSVIFSYIMKSLTANGLLLTIVYSLGKVAGVYLGNLIEDKLALGITEIEVFLNSKNRMKFVADNLREMGYSVNSNYVWGMNGEKRYMVETTLLRKEVPNYYKALSSMGIDEPTVKIRSISNVKGKIDLKKN